MDISEFPKSFDHATREREIYGAWEAAGAFRADRDSPKPAFVISMPPPNANGPLHLGHAMTLSIEDLLIRWRRMAGDEVLWLPGTDHASIATESFVIRQLQNKGIADPRRALKRDGLVREISKYVDESRTLIRAQIRRLGSSCDWSRERYTLDPTVSRIVNETFGRMFHDGLIYRGNRIVHWDVNLQTTLSDDEVRKEERRSVLYTIQFGRFQIATDQPELCLAATALGIHPRDHRTDWLACVGQWSTVQWPKGPTTRVLIIDDTAVDPKHGTGMVGIAPAHDIKDFEIGERKGLPFLTIFNEDGIMTEAAGPYKGLTRMECRKAFVKDLRDAKLLIAEPGHTESVLISERGGAPVEHLLKDQWFIDVNRPVVPWEGSRLSLRQVMEEVASSKRIRFIPEHQEKQYLHWIDNLRDWCISRQIWWGHRVPVWYRGESETYVGARTMPAEEGWLQDPDTLDTWFSSALWTWSTLVDDTAAGDFTLGLEQILHRSPDYQRFHPTTLLETGYDVLFFWVARMILATTFATRQIPFKTVYFHGLVRDKDGRTMSPSKPATCVDPQELITEHGADTLRLALIGPNSTSTDMQLTPDRIKGAKRFVAKLWNAARYVAMFATFGGARPDATHPVNRWILQKIDGLVANTTSSLDRYILGESAQSLRDSFHADFCDFYIEATKADSMRDLPETSQTLGHALETYLRLLHPFVPFVTEEIWKETGHEGFLMQQAWPLSSPVDDGTGRKVEGVEELRRLVLAIRNWRAEQQLTWRVRVDLEVWSQSHRDEIGLCAPVLSKLVDADRVRLVDADGVFHLEIDDQLKAAVQIVKGNG